MVKHQGPEHLRPEVSLIAGSAGRSHPVAEWLSTGQDRCVNPDLPTIQLRLWRADAVVLFDWLNRVDLDNVPIDHPAEKQALMDLLTRLEADTDIEYGSSGSGLTQSEIDAARAEVAKDMGW